MKTAINALKDLLKVNDIYKECMPYLINIIDEVYLPMEKEQIIESFKEGTKMNDVQDELSAGFNAVIYYYETYTND